MKKLLLSLEKILQTIVESHIEQSTLQLFREQLAYQLAEALAEPMDYVPDQIYIFVHPARAAMFQENQSHVLAQALAKAGEAVGLHFLMPPTITIVQDATLSIDDSYVQTQGNLAVPSDSQHFEYLIPPERETIPTGAFLIVKGKEIFHIRKSVITIGRRLDNHLVIDDPRISRTHAQIRYTGGKFVLIDSNSTGGSFINGQRVEHPTTLFAGDVITLSGITLVFGQDSPPAESDYTRPFPPQPAGDQPTQVRPTIPGNTK